MITHTHTKNMSSSDLVGFLKYIFNILVHEAANQKPWNIQKSPPNNLNWCLDVSSKKTMTLVFCTLWILEYFEHLYSLPWRETWNTTQKSGRYLCACFFMDAHCIHTTCKSWIKVSWLNLKYKLTSSIFEINLEFEYVLDDI